MSLDERNIIDAVGLEEKTGVVILNLFDGWDWQDEYEHLVALQNKLNTYLEFVENGQIYEEYPKARGRAIRIGILTKFPIPEVGLAFLKKAAEVAAQLDLTISIKTNDLGLS